MKITRRRLKEIIKEELSEVATGPPGGDEDIGEAAYQLGRHFAGALAERGEIVAIALEKAGARRAAEQLRLGSNEATIELQGRS